MVTMTISLSFGEVPWRQSQNIHPPSNCDCVKKPSHPVFAELISAPGFRYYEAVSSSLRIQQELHSYFLPAAKPSGPRTVGVVVVVVVGGEQFV